MATPPTTSPRPRRAPTARKPVKKAIKVAPALPTPQPARSTTHTAAPVYRARWWGMIAAVCIGIVLGGGAVYQLGGKLPFLGDPALRALALTIPDNAYANIPSGVDAAGIAHLGSPTAPVQMVEYSDFQCPFCARYKQATYPQILNTYIRTGTVQMAFRYLPLPFHGQARDAAAAASCAGEQQAFWPYHDALFANQALWSDKSNDKEIFLEIARRMKLDTSTLSTCMTSATTAKKIDTDLQDAQNHNLSGTPSFIIQGEQLIGAQPYAAFAQLIDKYTGSTTTK